MAVSDQSQDEIIANQVRLTSTQSVSDFANKYGLRGHERMHLRSLLFVWYVFNASGIAGAEEVPEPLQVVDRFLKLNNNWAASPDCGTVDDHCWANFWHQDGAATFSVVAQKVHGRISIDSSPVLQASIETFTNEGHARLSTNKNGLPISDTIRHRIVNFGFRNSDGEKSRQESIEFTYVYDGDSAAARTIGHGYAVRAGDFIYFVQHTSRTPISSEFAGDVALDIVYQHLHSASKKSVRWSMSIDRPQSK